MRMEDTLPCATTCIDFEYVMLTEISQRKNTVRYLFVESKKIKPIKKQSKMVVTSRGRVGKRDGIFFLLLFKRSYLRVQTCNE